MYYTALDIKRVSEKDTMRVMLPFTFVRAERRKKAMAMS